MLRRGAPPEHPDAHLLLAPGQHPAQGPERAHREDRRREVDQPQVPERVEVVRVVVGKRHEQTQDGGHRRTHPRPELAPTDAISHEEQDGHAGRGDEPRDRDVQVPDVVEQGRAELPDLVPPTFTSFGPIPSSRKASVKFLMRKITA